MYEITEKENEEAKIEAMALIQELSTDRQKGAVRAVRDLLEQGKSWYWIKTALYKKGKQN